VAFSWRPCPQQGRLELALNLVADSPARLYVPCTAYVASHAMPLIRHCLPERAVSSGVLLLGVHVFIYSASPHLCVQVVPQKPRKALGEITGSLCPALSMQQLYRISTMYWDDKYGTHSVNSDVVAQMRQQMTEESGAVTMGNSFLLDDDSRYGSRIARTFSPLSLWPP